MSTVARSGKSQAAFRTISEVADELDVAQHVLRFWESKFPQVRPLKRGGGRRYYRPEDIEMLRDIRSLLYDEGYTIKGAQKLLRQRRAKPQSPAKSADTPADTRSAQGNIQSPASDPPTPAGPPIGAEGPARANGDAEVPADAADSSTREVRPASAVSTARATAAGDIEKLQRLRTELVELRRAVDAALAATDH